MDFALLASDSSNAAFSLENGDADKHKCYGFGFVKQDRAINEEDLREFKMAKTTSSCGEGALRYPLQRSNASNLSSPHQMLSFSSPNSQPLTLPYYQYSSNAFSRNIAGINGGSMGQGVRGPFTPSQWMELEHQALIYKYITANVPIPSYLLNPIRKAFEAAGFSALRSNPLGWSGFQLGFSNTDPEPGRCRRTDGKKWRCSRDAVVDQKYCERHMNRGRHRSRKPVEANAKPTPARGVVETTTTTTLSKIKPKDPSGAQEWERHDEFGLVCSDSLVNPLNRSASLDKHALRQFMDERSSVNWRDLDRTQLSISIPMVTSDFMSSTSSPANTASSPPRELEMGLGVGNAAAADGVGLRHSSSSSSNWVPISWEPSSIGGPLGEVLHTTITGDTKQLNLIDRWDNNSPPLENSSPTGVLQRGPFVSLSNSSAASSPRHDAHCNRIVNPSLPAL